MDWNNANPNPFLAFNNNNSSPFNQQNTNQNQQQPPNQAQSGSAAASVFGSTAATFTPPSTNLSWTANQSQSQPQSNSNSTRGASQPSASRARGRARGNSSNLPSTSTQRSNPPTAAPSFSNKSAVFNNQNQSQPIDSTSNQAASFGGMGSDPQSTSNLQSDKRQDLQERLRKAKQVNNSSPNTGDNQQSISNFFSNQNPTSSQPQPQSSLNAFSSAFQSQPQSQPSTQNPSPFQSQPTSASAFGSSSNFSPSTSFSFGQSNPSMTNANQPAPSNPFGNTPTNNGLSGATSAFGAQSKTSAFGSAFSTSAFGSNPNPTPQTKFSSPIQSPASSPAPVSQSLATSNTFGSSPTPNASASSSPAPAASGFNSFLRKSTASNQTGTQRNSFGSGGNVSNAEEDEDEIRKKRFEGMEKVGERFVELKAIRAALREKYQKNGILPDPDRAQVLSSAQNVIGTCLEMCPEFERVEREYQKEADQFEVYPNSNVVNPLLAVKIYRRPAAGREIALPEDIRPPIILKKTLDYLFHRLLPTSPDNPMFGQVQGFLWNRTRAIRQDFIVQGQSEEITIECHERIARMHILYLHWKGGKASAKEDAGDGREWSEQQELEQLRKTLRSLIEFYDDYRLSTGQSSVNEAEFRSYNLLLHIQDPETLREAETLPNPIFLSASVQSALRIRAYAQRSNNLEKRGQPKNSGSTLNFWTRFFNELKKPEVSYLLACLAENVFPSIRTGAAKAMTRAFMTRLRAVPWDWLETMLSTDNKEELMELVKTWGFQTGMSDEPEPTLLVSINKDTVVSENKPISAPFSSKIVEAKRGSYTLQDIVDGRASGAAPLIRLDDSQGNSISQDAQAQVKALRGVMSTSSPSLDPRWLPEIQSQENFAALPPPVAPSSSGNFPSTSDTSFTANQSFPSTSTSISNPFSGPLKPSSIESPSQSSAQSQSAFASPANSSTLSAIPPSSVFASAFKPSAPSPLALPPQVASPSPSPAGSPASASTVSVRKDNEQKEASSSSSLQQVTSAFGQAPKSFSFSPSPAFSSSIQSQPQPQSQEQVSAPPPTSAFSSAPPLKPSFLAPPVQKPLESSTERKEDQSEVAAPSSLRSQGRKRAVSTSRSQATIDAAAQAAEDQAREEELAEVARKKAEEEEENRRLEAVEAEKLRREELLSTSSEGLMDKLIEEYLDIQVPITAMKVSSEEQYRRASLGWAFGKWISLMDLRREDARQKARLEEIKEKLRSGQVGNSAGFRHSISNGDVRNRRYQDQLDVSLRSSFRGSVGPLRRSQSLVQGQDERSKGTTLFEIAHQLSAKLWDFGSFHAALCLHFAHLVEQVQLGSLSRWVVALSTSIPKEGEEEQPATTWVREKLALNPGEEVGPAQDIIDGASLQVIDATSLVDENASQFDPEVGLVVFECSPLLGHASSEEKLSSLWNDDLQRLSALTASKSIRKGSFLPRLLIIFWSNDYALQTLSPNPSTRRKQIYSRLGFPATHGAWADVGLLELGDQDPQIAFEVTIQSLLPSIQWNNARRSLSLEDLVLPLKTPWTELVQNIQDGMNRLSQTISTSSSPSVQDASAQMAVKTMQNLIELANDLLYYLVDMSETILESVRELEIPRISYEPESDIDLNDAFYASAFSQLNDEVVSGQPELQLIRATLAEARPAGTPFPLSAYLGRLLNHSLYFLEQSWLGIRDGGEQDLESHVQTLKVRAANILESTSGAARSIWLDHSKLKQKANGSSLKLTSSSPAKRGAESVASSGPESSPSPSKKARSRAPITEQDILSDGPLAALRSLIASSNTLLDEE